MRFLAADDIRSWYAASLWFSGLREIQEPVIRLWEQLVDAGQSALPPGFLARLLEALRLVDPTGTQSAGQPPERLLLDGFARLPGWQHLVGRLSVAGPSDDAVTLALCQMLAEKAGGFTHEEVGIARSELAESRIAGEPPVSTGDPLWTPLLTRMYGLFLRNLLQRGEELTTADLFEAFHPALFRGTGTRILYRRMTASLRGFGRLPAARPTPREDSGAVVRAYGEPQVLPLGGYDSLTNRGDFSSLVPSELCYIEEGERVDLFDHKFLERQLWYYQREEGAVYRIRRQVVLHVVMNEALEQERHLATLFAFLLHAAERLFALFTKDILRFHVILDGYQATAFPAAIGFFRELLREFQISYDHLRLHTKCEALAAIRAEPGFQQWLLGPEARVDRGWLPFTYPLDDVSLSRPESDQWRGLRLQLDEALTTLWRQAGQVLT